MARLPSIGAVLLGAFAASAAETSTLRIGVSTLAPEKANPYQGITVPAVLPSQAIFDSLTALDRQGNVIPQLATGWSSDDGVTWRFELRPGVRFSNGERFDARALAVSVAHMRGERGRTETIGSTLYHVDRVVIVDDLTVDIVLSEIDALFPLHASVWRVPAPGAWQELGLPAFGSAPVGSGPFEVVEWNDRRAVLTASSSSWRKPRVDALEFIRVPDQAARLQALASGALDMALELAPEDRAVIEQKGGRMAVRLTPNVHFLAFLTVNDSPVRDVRVRRALNYAVDRALITEQLLEGATRPASQLAFPGSFGYNESLRPYPYDPEKAKALLREAGYPNGLELRVTVSLAGGNDALYYQQVAADLAKVGVEVDLQAHPRGILLTGLFNGTLKGDAFNLLVRGHDPLNAYRHRTCLELVVERAPYHCDPDLIPLVKAARRQTDMTSARDYYQRVLAQEHANPPGLLLWQAPAFDGLSDRVSGYRPVQDVINFDTLELGD